MQPKKTKPIYLDNQATTPLDPRALEAMMPYFTEKFGNPHSSTHQYGWEADAGVEIGRRQVAELINASPKEITFTSGATEANNLAIKGVMQAARGRRPHMVTLNTEHKCVLVTAEASKLMGCEVTVVPVESNGIADLDKLAEAIRPDTALVSVMTVNNEIGVIQPIAEIAKLAHAKGALLHTDAAQAFGKIPMDVKEMGIDLMSISAHKAYGPKGVGALYVDESKKIDMAPQMTGGSQEEGARAGTLSPALCAGFGMAAHIASQDMGQESGRIKSQMARFKDKLLSEFPTIIVNGDENQRWAGNLNLGFPGLDGSLLLANLRGVAVSSGSACASSTGLPSYVLTALGREARVAKSSLRIGIGRFTTDEEIDKAADIFTKTLKSMGGVKGI